MKLWPYDYVEEEYAPLDFDEEPHTTFNDYLEDDDISEEDNLGDEAGIYHDMEE